MYKVGYESKRIVYRNHEKIEVLCSVSRSANGVPLFGCSFMLEGFGKKVLSTNPTNTTNKILKLLDVSVNKLSGNDFFGFHKQDVNQGNKSARISLVGIQSYGVPVINDSRYMYCAGKHKLRLQPGFESVLQVNGFCIHCKIDRSLTSPKYVCFTEDEAQSCESSKPTLSMNNLFKALGIASTRNRSGYEFFGLNRIDVLQVLKTDILDYKDPIVEAEC